MATKAAASAHHPDPVSTEPSRVSVLLGAVRRRLPLVVFLAVIIGVQAAVSLLLAPVAADGDHAKPASPLTAGEDGTGLVKVEIDEFHCMNSLAEPGIRIAISFKAVASAAPDQAELLREAVTVSRKYRIREAVIRAVRGSGHEELNEPEQIKLRRQVKNEINRVLPADYVHAVEFLEFKQAPQ